MANVIIIKGDPLDGQGLAGAAILPGDLIEWFAGTPDVLVPHSTSTGVAAPIFAREDFPAGEEIDVAYASGSTVQVLHARRGDHINAWLADGQTAEKGGFLASNGAGKLTVSTTNPVAQAAEDKTASGADARIIVEVL